MNTNKNTNVLTALDTAFCCGEVMVACPSCGANFCLFCEMECC